MHKLFIKWWNWKSISYYCYKSISLLQFIFCLLQNYFMSFWYLQYGEIYCYLLLETNCTLDSVMLKSFSYKFDEGEATVGSIAYLVKIGRNVLFCKTLWCFRTIGRSLQQNLYMKIFQVNDLSFYSISFKCLSYCFWQYKSTQNLFQILNQSAVLFCLL